MEFKHIAFQIPPKSETESLLSAKDFYQEMNARRSVRFFSDQAVAREVIEQIVLTAGTAPSGAHKQPWKFCIVENLELKQKIRDAAEKEEKESYATRMSQEWLEDLASLGTDWEKPFLTTAPYLIIVFRKPQQPHGSGMRQNYYVQESVGIACGLLLAAIQKAGLVALTHTPSPMNFLQDLLGRPSYEKPYLLIPVGYPALNCTVPELSRKPLDEIAEWF